MRGMAVLVLVLQGNVNWKYGAPMAIGGLIGGYIGGTISHRANRTLIRSIVIAIGFAASAYFFWKSVRSGCIAYRSRVGEVGTQRRHRPSVTATNALRILRKQGTGDPIKAETFRGESYHL